MISRIENWFFSSRFSLKKQSVEAVFPRAALPPQSAPPLLTVGCDRSCSGLLFRVVLLSSSIHWFLCPELLQAEPVLALSGSGVFVVTRAVDDSDRG
ncbi:hypothetical protein ACOSQ2_004799 [Xanthoceras sorbifolium]